MVRADLKALVEQTPRAVAGALLDADGALLQWVFSGGGPRGPAPELPGAARFVVEQARRAGEILGLGALQELTIHGERVTLLVQAMQRGRLLCLALRPPSPAEAP